MTQAIQIKNLTVRKGNQSICHVDNFSAQSNGRIAIVGDNGTGKTTLLRVLAGFESEFSGECHVDFATQSRVLVHQSPFLFRGGVLFNAKYGLSRVHGNISERRRLANTWLEKLGVGHLASRTIRGLSGGECRRIALARAMVLRPKLLLLDEPFAELDTTGRSAVCAAIEELTDTLVIITSPQALPIGFAGEVFELKKG